MSSYKAIPGSQLTMRQLEILTLLAKGKTNKGIANALGLTESTVSSHLKAIFDKLEINTRVQAAVYAVKQGLV